MRGEQARIAREVGISAPYMNRILSGENTGAEDKRIAIASSIGYTYEETLDLGRWILLGKSGDDWPGISRAAIEAGFVLSSKVTMDAVPKVPVISWVQAGAWTEIIDNFQPGDAEEWIQVFQNVSRGTFALKITGDSMEPEFREGEIIAVDPAVQPETGKYVVAKIESDNGNNGEATFKQFVRDGNQVFLKPLNAVYPLMDMTGKRFKIIGCVVQKTKKY